MTFDSENGLIRQFILSRLSIDGPANPFRTSKAWFNLDEFNQIMKGGPAKSVNGNSWKHGCAAENSLIENVYKEVIPEKKYGLKKFSYCLPVAR